MYFKVTIAADHTFPAKSIILWEDILENVGDGYDANTGKFMAPQAGTYRFVLTVMNAQAGDEVYLHLVVNGAGSCVALASEVERFQTGVCTQVVRLAAGDEVWVINPDWGATYLYRKDFTAFEGFMIHERE